jgi:anti-sigma factor ChrR (cupin superfamily)
MMHPDEDRLNAYADGSIDAAGRADIDAHLAGCPRCRQTVDDIAEILRATSALELREPPARAWARLERAIAFDVESRQSSSAEPSATPGSSADDARRRLRPLSVLRSRSSLAWLAAAAALILAAFVGLRYAPPAGSGGETVGSAARTSEAPADSAQVEAELREAEAHYENAIKGLEQIANAEQNELDPKTAATLQKNLAVIDQAISESRAAVRSQPASEPAQQSLIENFKTKIGLLQDTVALINEMRKGNEAGAARIVSGLKDKGD